MSLPAMSRTAMSRIAFGGDYNPEQPRAAARSSRRSCPGGWTRRTTPGSRTCPVLDARNLCGPYPDVPDLETAVRVAPDGTRLLFLLNHGDEPLELAGRGGGVDLLSGDRVECGRPIRLPPRGVMVVREDT